jgi:hypothetical protein
LPPDVSQDEGSQVTLDDEDIERIAARVAELLEEEGSADARYVDAAFVARKLGVDRDWVYAHARELGGVRLGGPQGRLRFDLARIARHLACPATSGSRPATRRPRRQQPKKVRSDVELIPYTEVRCTGQIVAGRRVTAPGPTTGGNPDVPIP